MKSKQKNDEFLVKFNSICTKLEMTIAYANRMLKDLLIPKEIQATIQKNIFQIIKLHDKYTLILEKNLLDKDYFNEVEKILAGYLIDLKFMHDFLSFLDLCFMAYGDGPEFKIDKLIYKHLFDI